MNPPEETTIAPCPRCRAPIALADGRGRCRQCGARVTTRPGAPLSPPIVVGGGPAAAPDPFAEGRVLMWRIFLGFGLLFGLIGAGLLVGWQRYDPTARAAALPQLSAAALSDSEPGREGLLEGRISPRNRAAANGLVAYVREELRGDGDDEAWYELERVTPPLLVDLPDGLVELTGDRYIIENAPRREQEPGGVWRSGFAVGDPVVVIGRAAAGEGPALAPERIVGGSRADYLADLAGQRHVLLWIGLPFVAFGLLFGGLAVALRRAG